MNHYVKDLEWEMPTYVVSAVEGRFAPEQKARLAEAITSVHCSATGAPRFLVQVIFSDIAVGNYFIGGKTLKFDNVLVHGHIEGGRPSEATKLLLAELLYAVALISETDRSAVQIFIVDVPALQVAEWGQVIPKAGDEAAWESTLPDDVRRRTKLVEETDEGLRRR